MFRFKQFLIEGLVRPNSENYPLLRYYTDRGGIPILHGTKDIMSFLNRGIVIDPLGVDDPSKIKSTVGRGAAKGPPVFWAHPDTGDIRHLYWARPDYNVGFGSKMIIGDVANLDKTRRGIIRTTIPWDSILTDDPRKQLQLGPNISFDDSGIPTGSLKNVIRDFRDLSRQRNLSRSDWESFIKDYDKNVGVELTVGPGEETLARARKGDFSDPRWLSPQAAKSMRLPDIENRRWFQIAEPEQIHYVWSDTGKNISDKQFMDRLYSGKLFGNPYEKEALRRDLSDLSPDEIDKITKREVWLANAQERERALFGQREYPNLSSARTQVSRTEKPIEIKTTSIEPPKSSIPSKIVGTGLRATSVFDPVAEVAAQTLPRAAAATGMAPELAMTGAMVPLAVLGLADTAGDPTGDWKAGFAPGEYEKWVDEQKKRNASQVQRLIDRPYNTQAPISRQRQE